LAATGQVKEDDYILQAASRKMLSMAGFVMCINPSIAVTHNARDSPTSVINLLALFATTSDRSMLQRAIIEAARCHNENAKTALPVPPISWNIVVRTPEI
jgi:hypothetical protein